jgi:hypothetical protein
MLLSTALLAQGCIAEARQVAMSGVQELEQMGSLGLNAVAVYLALSESCFAEGDTNNGETALRKALQCVRARANDILDTALRERFLRQVPENARTLELARQRWGDVSAWFWLCLVALTGGVRPALLPATTSDCKTMLAAPIPA